MKKGRHSALCFCLLLAGNLSMHAQTVTLGQGMTTLKAAFEKIEKASKYKIAYNASQIDADKQVTPRKSKGDVLEILALLLKENGLNYEINGNYITVKPATTNDSQQPKKSGRNLTGTVTDATGEPIVGATVMVKGTSKGTITDLDGNYTLDGVPADADITISYVGFQPVTLKSTDTKLKNLALQEDNKTLSEVVVVGYGTQKKSSLTSAVSAVKGEELLKAPATNVSQLLGGRLPGISSLQESGEPGLDQASLKIRGSVYNVSYVVDGFPVSSINDIDPNDIESISVLKDGASAAVYGLAGAGGVIIITTKRGEIGKTKVTYDVSYGVSMNANFPKFMNGPQYAYYYNMAQMMDQLASGAIKDRNEYVPYYTKENIEAMTNGDPTDGWDNVNYIDKVFGTGTNQKHSITVQGGNEKMRYFTSLGYMKQNGNIDNFDHRRYNLRANIESEFAKHFNFKLGVSGVVGRRSTPAFNSGGGDNGDEEVGFLSIARQTIQMHPYLPERYNGMYTAAIQKNTSLPNSPLAAIYESGYRKTRSLEGNVNLELTYNVPWVKGLALKANGSYNYSTSHNKNLNTLYSVMGYNNGTWSKYEDPRGTSDGTALGEGQTTYEQLVGQAGISYTNSFGLHNVEALALVEARDNKSHGLSAYAKNLPFVQLPELGFGVPAENPIGGWSAASRTAGYVFRLKYDYDSKYMAEFTGRYDGSYKFYGMGKRWGFFPSASLGWRISKEKFMENLDFINDLKVRASIGLLGNDAVSEYAFLSTYSQWESGVIYPSGTSAVKSSGIYTSGIPNPNLTWEKTLSWNAGFDATLWNGLLSIELDAFYNYTYDVLTGMGGGKPSSMGGYYPTYGNHNALDSKGIDILLSHRSKFQLARSSLQYSISGNLTYSKTRWLKYLDDPNIMEWQKVVGTTYGTIYGWKADGLFRSEEEIDNSAWYGSRPCLGDIKYVDMNGDGKIDSQDRGAFGRSNRPQLTFGLNIGASWKGFDFNALFTGGALFDVSLTGTYYNGYDDNTIWTQTFKESANSPLFLVENAYSIDNPNGTFPRITLGSTGHGGDNGLSSSFWWRDGKYVRLKSAQIGYTFPKMWMSKLNIQNLRIFVEGSNLFTIDGLPEGIDPESPGVNNGYYPQQRTVMGGLTLTF